MASVEQPSKARKRGNERRNLREGFTLGSSRSERRSMSGPEPAFGAETRVLLWDMRRVDEAAAGAAATVVEGGSAWREEEEDEEEKQGDDAE